MPALAYDRVGTGPPLVLLHPLGADRHVWEPVLRLLAPERECIAVDLPGFGESPVTDAGVEPAAIARAVRALVDELGLSDPHLAGNSLGGWVALEAGLAGWPASVTAIAPAGLWPRPLGPKPQIARRLARASRPLLRAALRSPGLRSAVLRSSMAHPERVPADAAAGLVLAYADAPGFTAANRAMRSGQFLGLADVTVPITLVWPEFDRLIARPRTVPAGVRQIELPGCGHMPMWDDPEAVATALLEGSARAPSSEAAA